MTGNPANPTRGEIWRVNFDPTIGAEIKKTRPAVVISSDAVGKLPLKLTVPITTWDEAFARNFWHIRIEPDALNHLSRPSAADTLQVRCVDRQRFVDRMGRVSPAVLEEIVSAVAAVIEYQ